MFAVLSAFVLLLTAVGFAFRPWQAATDDPIERWALCIGLGVLIDFWLVLIGLTLGRVLIVAGILALGGAWNAVRDVRRVRGGRSIASGRWTIGLIAYLLAIYYFRILSEPVKAWDARSIWFFHARMMWLADGLRHAGWDHPSIVFSNPDYPKLVGALAAQLAHARGFWNEFFPKASLFILLVPAVLLAFGFRAARASFALIVLALFVAYNEWLSNGYMDGYLLIYSGIVLLCAGRFADSRRWIDLQSAFCALGIVCSLKNEGLLFAVCVAASAVAVLACTKSGLRDSFAGIRANARLLVVPVLALLPAITWTLYKTALGLQNPLTTGPSSGLARIVGRLTDGSSPGYIFGFLLVRANGLWVTAAAAAALLVFAWRSGRRVHPGALLSVMTAILHFCGMFVVYLSTPAELTFHLTTSAFRVMASTRTALVVAVYFLLADLERRVAAERRTEDQRARPRSGADTRVAEPVY